MMLAPATSITEITMEVMSRMLKGWSLRTKSTLLLNALTPKMLLKTI